MADKAKNAPAAEANLPATYTREQVLQSVKYRPYRDIAGIVLKEGQSYTAAEIQQKIDDFLQKPITEKINGKG
ncbi:MAG TPA: hypothetical protein PKA10_07810 [Selenomonadales bacterium]|nr:hypothetical protein [Selenomonadales bacterium]